MKKLLVLCLYSVFTIYAGSQEQEDLFIAAKAGSVEGVHRALAAGAVVDTVSNFYGMTALMIAAYGGHTKIVEELIVAKADLNQVMAG